MQIQTFLQLPTLLSWGRLQCKGVPSILTKSTLPQESNLEEETT